MKIPPATKTIFLAVFAAFLGFMPLYGQNVRTAQIDVNLIIDGSAAVSGILDDISAWISGNLVDQTLREGDQITIWSAGETAKVIYSDTVKTGADKETIKQTIGGLSGAGDNPDFSGALREAASRRARQISYTVLISAASSALSPVLHGPVVRFSKTEEFHGWRAWVIGLNLDSKVRQAATAYLGQR